MVDATGFFIQFPHPGGEHNPPADHMPWNVAGHRRKFLIAPGECLDGDDRVLRGRAGVLGRVGATLPRGTAVARRRPPASSSPPPLLDGARDQRVPAEHRPMGVGRPNDLQQLQADHRAGASAHVHAAVDARIDHLLRFHHRWRVLCRHRLRRRLDRALPAEAAELAVDEAFKACTGGAITAGGRDAHVSLTLYRGATVENPVEGMFSFVPARRADEDDPRFTRPPIRLPGFINPASRQSTRGSKRPLPMDTLRDTWNALHHQVVAADLLLRSGFRLPSACKTTLRSLERRASTAERRPEIGNRARAAERRRLESVFRRVRMPCPLSPIHQSGLAPAGSLDRPLSRRPPPRHQRWHRYWSARACAGPRHGRDRGGVADLTDAVDVGERVIGRQGPWTAAGWLCGYAPFEPAGVLDESGRRACVRAR